MNKPRDRSAWSWRVSLRELLLLVSYVALACASLLNANALWVTIVFSLTCLVVLLMVILCVAERGRRQVAALSGVIILLIYGVLWTYEPEIATKTDFRVENGAVASLGEVVDYQGHLPSSHLLNRVWEQVSGTYLYDAQSNRIIEKSSSSYRSGNQPVPSSELPTGKTFQQVYYRGFPAPNHFVPIGHCLFALLLAYLGGKMAVWVYLRRLAREQRQET